MNRDDAIVKKLTGRRIEAVELNTFRDGQGLHFDPVLTLDDGTKVTFHVTETEASGYGVTPILRLRRVSDGKPKR